MRGWTCPSSTSCAESRLMVAYLTLCCSILGKSLPHHPSYLNHHWLLPHQNLQMNRCYIPAAFRSLWNDITVRQDRYHPLLESSCRFTGVHHWVHFLSCWGHKQCDWLVNTVLICSVSPVRLLCTRLGASTNNYFHYQSIYRIVFSVKR